MGLELAKAYISVRGESMGLSGDLHDVQSKVETALRNVNAHATAIFGSLAYWGKDIISQGLQAAGSFEQTTNEMETMLGSAAEAQKTLSDLTKFAVETPFEMPQLLNVTRGLIQFGERGDSLMETIRILGDASGGTAEKFSILGLVFNQIRGVGHLLTQDFRQLSSRGIISLQDIANHYKVTTHAAQEMLSTGQISFEDFRKIMKGLTEEGGRFNNMMLKQSTTLVGLNSTYQDAKNIAIRLLATPLIPWAKKMTEGMILLSGATEKLVRNGGKVVSYGFAGAVAFSSLTTAIYGARLAMFLFGVTSTAVLSGVKAAIMKTGWGLLIVGLGAAIGMAIGYFNKTGNKANEMGVKGGGAVNSMKKEIVSATEATKSLGHELKKALGESLIKSVEVIEKLKKNMDELRGIAINAGVGMKDIAAALKEREIKRVGKELTPNITAFLKESAKGTPLQEFNSALRLALANAEDLKKAVGPGMFENFTAGLKKKIEELSGITEELKKLENEIAVIEGLKNEEDVELEKMERKGVLKEDLDKMAELMTQKTLAEKAKAKKEDFRARAEAIIEKTKSPLTKFQEEIAHLDEIREAGLITPAQFARARRLARQDFENENGPDFLESGRHGFQDAGTKIQDILLSKDKKDWGRDQVALAEVAIRKQDELIKAVERITPFGALK